MKKILRVVVKILESMTGQQTKRATKKDESRKTRASEGTVRYVELIGYLQSLFYSGRFRTVLPRESGVSDKTQKLSHLDGSVI